MAGLPSQPEIIKPHKYAHVSCRSTFEAIQKAKSPTCASPWTDPEALQPLRMLISDRRLSTRMMEKLNISGGEKRLCFYLIKTCKGTIALISQVARHKAVEAASTVVES